MVLDLCSTVQAENIKVENVELKVKPQEVVGRKRVAHEAKHLEVNVESLNYLNCEYWQVIHYIFLFSKILCNTCTKPQKWII